jgi:hypothetical protein
LFTWNFQYISRSRLAETFDQLMLTFLTGKYLDVYSFVESCNDCFPGVQMIGGLANTSEINLKKFVDSGFVFNENGYSNLQHIAGISCDFLKVDGSMIRSSVQDKQSANLVALISGWKRISDQSFRIIAEHVENQAIQDLLTKNGIDFSQGYLFSKPSPELCPSAKG